MTTQLDVTNDPRTDEEDLQADKKYRIAAIEALRKELNEGTDRVIKQIRDASTQDEVWQAHKSLLNGISWAAKEERDLQIDLE